MTPRPNRFRTARRTTRRAALIVVATGVTAALVVPPALGGTGIGAIFNLGKTNTVNKPTVLTGATSTRMLQVTNSGSGSALALTTKAGVAPMRVSSTGKVTRLNADLLDGKDSSAFMAANARPDANTLDGKDSTAFMPATGQTLITVGPMSWIRANSASSAIVTHFPDYTRWQRTATGAESLIVSPTLPVVTNGRGLVWKGVQLCYSASALALLSSVTLYTTTASATAGVATPIVVDPTDRTDTACRIYTPTSPVLLGVTDSISVYANLLWTDASGSFRMGRTTFIFEASPTPVAPLIP